MLLSRSPGILERVSARPPKRRTRIAVRILAGLPALAACSSSPPVPPAASPATSATSPATSAASPASSAASSVRTTPPTAPASVAARVRPRVTVSQLRTADGSVVTLAVFRGAVQYVLHNGSQDPGPRYAALVRAGPAVSGAERRHLVPAPVSVVAHDAFRQIMRIDFLRARRRRSQHGHGGNQKGSDTDDP